MVKCLLVVVLTLSLAIKVEPVATTEKRTLLAGGPSNGTFVTLDYDKERLSSIIIDQTYTVKATVDNCTVGKSYRVISDVNDGYLARVSSPENATLCDASRETSFNISIYGKFMGFTTVDIKVLEVPDSVIDDRRLDIGVIRVRTVIDEVFQYSVISFVCLITLGFGASMDLVAVKEIMKRPVAPAIGLCCQYSLMPLIAFGVGYVIQLDTALALGLFAAGCAPGGGSSNIWSLLLGGNADLSITMTLISTIMSIGLIPAWVYSLGSLLTTKAHISIPFVNIFISILSVAVPISLGLVVSKFLPKVAKILTKLLKPISLIFVIGIFIFGAVANQYLFIIMGRNWRILTSGIIVPFIGFFTAALVAAILKQDRPFILTIALETSIQNTGIAILFLQNTLPHPYSDLAIVMPISMNIFLPLPFIIAAVIRWAYLKKKATKDAELDAQGEKELVVCDNGGYDKIN